MKLSERKKLDILTAAEKLFCEKGVEHTSMVEIAQVANVSKRTLYNHFEHKGLLFAAILASNKEQLTNTQVVEFDENKGLDEQLKSIARSEVNLLKSDQFIRIAKMALDQMMKDPELSASLSTMKVGCSSYLEAFLLNADKAGWLSIEDVEFASKQFVYQLKSFVFYPHLYNFDVPTVEQEAYIIDQTVQMFIARYTAK